MARSVRAISRSNESVVMIVAAASVDVELEEVVDEFHGFEADGDDSLPEFEEVVGVYGFGGPEVGVVAVDGPPRDIDRPRHVTRQRMPQLLVKQPIVRVVAGVGLILDRTVVADVGRLRQPIASEIERVVIVIIAHRSVGISQRGIRRQPDRDLPIEHVIQIRREDLVGQPIESAECRRRKKLSMPWSEPQIFVEFVSGI